jgi:hypothetical protein
MLSQCFDVVNQLKFGTFAVWRVVSVVQISLGYLLHLSTEKFTVERCLELLCNRILPL